MNDCIVPGRMHIGFLASELAGLFTSSWTVRMYISCMYKASRIKRHGERGCWEWNGREGMHICIVGYTSCLPAMLVQRQHTTPHKQTKRGDERDNVKPKR